MQDRIMCLVGLVAMIALAWAVSSDRKRFPFRVVIGGLLLQLTLGLIVLRTAWGHDLFLSAGEAITRLLEFVDTGSLFMFGINPRGSDPAGDVFPANYSLLRTFAFGVLPTIIFFSSLMSILYHLGIMQWIVRGMAWVMQRSLGTSGPETLSAAANVFVGHTEAPLVVKPYLATMTRSELNALMTGGFATVTGGLLGAYVNFGISASHLLTASVISAPAALLIAKVMLPESQTPASESQTLASELQTPASESNVSEPSGADSKNSEGNVCRTTDDETSLQAEVDSPSASSSDTLHISEEKISVNVIGAAVQGASDGLHLALNVGAMLIAFLALIAMIDALLVSIVGVSFDQVLGYVFSPLALAMGIPMDEAVAAGRFIGLKTTANEFIAYMQLGQVDVGAADSPISERTKIILTYALAGFSNFSAIGIQVGGIGGLAPSRKDELAKLGLRAMFGGLLACCMTGAIAGLLL